MESSVVVRTAPPPLPAAVRGEPPPRHGGPVVLLRFLRAHGMLNTKYARLALRLAWLKLRWRGRLVTDALARAAVNRGHGVHRPRRDDRDRQGRQAASRPLVVDRARHQDPRARGRG